MVSMYDIRLVLLKGGETLLEVLEFVFSSFWIWLGTTVTLGVVAEGLGATIRSFKE